MIAVINKRKPLLAVDTIIRKRDGSIVLVKRLNPPLKDFYAILGGFSWANLKAELRAIWESNIKVWKIELAYPIS